MYLRSFTLASVPYGHRVFNWRNQAISLRTRLTRPKLVKRGYFDSHNFFHRRVNRNFVLPKSGVAHTILDFVLDLVSKLILDMLQRLLVPMVVPRISGWLRRLGSNRRRRKRR